MKPQGLISLLLLAQGALATRPKNAILLSNVQTLTVKANARTTHRRVSSIPQLKCISHNKICALHAIEVMRCTNQGSSYDSEDVEWSCSATLPDELKLGSTDVICEGYESPDDPYVLKGSCGVEYRLALTKVGEQRYPELAGGGGGAARFFSDEQGEVDLSAWLFTIVFLAVLCWIVYSACYGQQRQQRRPRAAPRRGGGGGGGGGPGGGWGPPDDDDNDPPPPYPGTKPSSSRRQQQQGWRPGFGTGVAGGAAAGYAAGRYGQRGNQDNRASSSRSGWGAGSSEAPSSSGSSSATYDSTGFGSTSRR